MGSGYQMHGDRVRNQCSFEAPEGEKIDGMLARFMNAGVLYGREDLRLERVEVPIAGPGEIVVQVAAALTCGTDLKVYRRGYHARMLKPPMPFGHELAGIVSEVGAGVTKFSVGERIVPLNSAPCDACYFCRHKPAESVRRPAVQ